MITTELIIDTILFDCKTKLVGEMCILINNEDFFTVYLHTENTIDTELRDFL